MARSKKMPTRKEWDKAIKLLQEGANGFGRVLVATSDQEATYSWTKRCHSYLQKLRTLSKEAI